MLVYSLLIESVDLRRLSGSAGGNDFLGNSFDGFLAASREKKLGPLTRKGLRDSAANPASGPVDHRNLILEHNLSLVLCRGVESRPQPKLGLGLPYPFRDLERLGFTSHCHGNSSSPELHCATADFAQR